MERTKTFADVADDSRRKQAMAEYIEREALIADIEKRYCRPCEAEGKDYNHVRCRACWVDDMVGEIGEAPFEDVAPVVHGQWIECDDDDHLEDAYNHHKCTNCNTVALFDYKYREDWDEGMDGEWYSLGIIDDGINEHLTPYCSNCGARMDGE